MLNEELAHILRSAPVAIMLDVRVLTVTSEATGRTAFELALKLQPAPGQEPTYLRIRMAADAAEAVSTELRSAIQQSLLPQAPKTAH